MTYEPGDAKEIFLHALELHDPAERATYLDEACRGQDDLRQRVESLLRSHDEPGSFLQQPAVADLTAASSASGSSPPEQRASAMPLDFLAPCSTPGRLGRLGDYEIIEVIGQGGMGVVLKAYDTRLNRVVAIKVLSPALAFHPTAAKRFLREARAAAAVSHDHVVTIFAIDEASVPPYLVMECISGQSLQQKIDRQGTLETSEILRIGLQIAEGLAAAHKQGLIHRDIKPANILLENGVERVKITDFGLARAVDDVSMTQTGNVAGTPQYMSPEQSKGERLDARSDLFSLGSVLYTMCTGRPAFRAESTVAVLRRVCDDTPRPIGSINPEIPAWLVAVIDKLLAKRPEDRYQSAAEVAQALSAYLAWSQQPAGSPAPPMPSAPSHARPGAPWPLIVGVLLVGVAVPFALAVLVAAIVARGYLQFRSETVASRPVSMPEQQAEELGPELPVATSPPMLVVPFDGHQARAAQENWAQHLGIPVEYTDPAGLEYRLIPPGEFAMGSSASDVHALVRELKLNKASEFDQFVVQSSAPRHAVRITRPFYLARYEVTLEQFQKFVDETGYRSTLEALQSPAFTWKSLSSGDGEMKRPVYGVSWEDATAFCRWLTRRHRLTCELPSEAQWEYACRAGSAGRWSFGDEATPLSDYAVFEQESTSRPLLVGSKKANAFGLYDMEGNVEEWCQDWHKSDFYSRSPTEDPVCLEAAEDPASGRVTRGGGWYREAWRTRASTRSYDFPGHPVHLSGFRVAIVGDLQEILQASSGP